MFLSIKGIYYQAEVNGETITWLTPYQFCHEVSQYLMSNKVPLHVCIKALLQVLYDNYGMRGCVESQI